MKCNRKNNRAFTLIELIVVISVMGILAVIGSNFLQSGFNSYYTQQNITQAKWQGRTALEEMIREISMMRSNADISAATSSTLTFTDIDGQSNSYAMSGSTLQYNGIPLADGVSNFNLTYLDSTATATTTIANIRYINISFNVILNNVNYIYTTTVCPLNLQ